VQIRFLVRLCADFATFDHADDKIEAALQHQTNRPTPMGVVNRRLDEIAAFERGAGAILFPGAAAFGKILRFQ